MATRTYLEVCKTEAYMDAAFSSAFSDLRKGAQRKSQSNQTGSRRFDPMISIMRDDDDEKKTSQTCERKDSKLSWAVICAGDSDKTKPLEVEKSECEAEMAEEDLKLQWRVISGDKRGNHQTVQGSRRDNKMKSYPHRSLGCLNKSREFVTDQEPPSEYFPESVNRRENMSNFNGDSARSRYNRHSSDGTETRTKNSRSGIRKEKDVADKTTAKPSGDLHKNHPPRVKDNTRHLLPSSSSENSLGKENVHRVKKNGSDFKNNLSGTRNQGASKGQSSLNSSLDKNMTLRSKRTRCDSGSSSDSRVPLQKKPLPSVEHDRENSFDTKNFLSTMLSVKIIQEAQWHEYTVSFADFNRIKRKYPKLSEVLPDIDTDDKEISFSFDAVKSVFGFLFNPPYNYNMMPRGKTAVEVLAAAMSWGIRQFHNPFLDKFLKTITQDNCSTIYSFAGCFGLHEVCDACKSFVSEKISLNERLHEMPVRSRKCSVSVYTYVEPSEFCIPLEKAFKDFEDCFDKDIRNTIIFDSVSSDCSITGFGILLDTESCSGKSESTELDVYYTTKFINGNSETEEVKVSKPFRSNIAIHFKKKIIVREGQTLKISVETTIKPSLCFVTSRKDVHENTSGGVFTVNLESTYKVGNSDEKRFFIGKLLYNALDPAD